MNNLEKVECQVFEKAGSYTYQQGTKRLLHIERTPTKDFGYDANGNITSANNRTFAYDLSNRLIKVEDNSVIIAEYIYNGLNQRIKKILNGETRIFHYDLQGKLIAETNASGQTLVEYFYLGDQPLAMIRPGELIYYYHNDHLGTPQILTNDTQTIAWKAIYTPFGEAEISIQSVENPFRFPGQYYDQETGLHYNWNRYYNPKTGRYLTPDPIGLKGGINLFFYVQNNPVNNTDPLGLTNEEPPVIRPDPPKKPKPPDYPIPPGWSPPFPVTLCELKCYYVLFMDYLICNIYWHWEYQTDDPHRVCPGAERRHNEECKRDAYNHYRRCIKACSE